MRVLSIVYFLVSSISLAAEPWHIASGRGQVHLLELYTSEGCSSCPPADAYLRGLRRDGNLWKTFIPVAFHVDYWNDLGWRDRFSSSEYSDRQRALAAQWGRGGVYTPGFVLDGAEVGSQGRGREKGLANAPDVGVLSVERVGSNYRVRFEPAVAGMRWNVRAVVLGNHLTTAVASGENARQTLRHDFVVLALRGATMAPSDKGFVSTVKSLSADNLFPGERSLVFWVERDGDPRPVQAVGADVPMDLFGKESL